MTILRFDKENKQWNKIDRENKKQNDIVLDDDIIHVLDHVKKDLKRERDVGCIVFGGVGSGKSTLGRLMCRYVSDEHFHPKTHMVRDVNDIAIIMKKAKKGEGIVFDEASGIFGSTDALTKKTKYAQLVLDVCRQKNLFLVIIAPQFHRLTSPVALDRTEFALRTYFTKSGQRGKYCFYGRDSKAKLYQHAKKNFGKLNIRRLKIRYGFFGEDTLYEEEYRQVKDETLNLVLDSFEKNKKKAPTEAEVNKRIQMRVVEKNLNKPSKQLAEILGLSDRTIRDYKQKIKEKYEKAILMNQIASTMAPV